MSPLLIAHLVVVAGYAGFQWTVQLLVYRQFVLVPVEAFGDYERSHQRRVTFVVGPLFAGMVLTTGGLLFLRPTGLPWWGPVGAAVLAAIILSLTAFSAVPLHGRLSGGWSAPAFRSLLRTDLVRAVAATANVAVAVVMLARPGGPS